MNENFSYDEPSESVYKITGARGSGKTIILAKIEEELSKDENWCVCRLSVNRDMLTQILGDLTNKGIVKNKNTNPISPMDKYLIFAIILRFFA